MALPAGDDLGTLTITLTAVFLFLAYIVVALRLWSTKLNKRAPGINDYLILTALAFATGCFTVSTIAVVNGGLGQHVEDVLQKDPETLLVFGKTFIAMQPQWATAVTLIRLSILTTYITIFRTPWFRLVCKVCMGFVSVMGVIELLLGLLICQPLSMNWDKTTPGGHCGDEVAAYLLTHIINSVGDIILAILPIPVLWKLQMARRKKIEISLMFSLGALICILALVRVGTWQVLFSLDITHDTVFPFIATSLEPTLGVILASLPFVRTASAKIIDSDIFSWARTLTGSTNRSAQSSEGLSKDARKDYNNSNNRRQFVRLGERTHFHTQEDDIETFPLKVATSVSGGKAA